MMSHLKERIREKTMFFGSGCTLKWNLEIDRRKIKCERRN